MSDFAIRHYVPARDLVRLSSMLTEIESTDHDGEDTSADYLLNALSWHNYRPDQDVWVAELNGELAGYAVALEQPARRCTIYAAVHPARRRTGLGSQLVSLALNRAREFDATDILVYANEHNEASKSFLMHHQFQQVGSSGALNALATLESPPPEFPDGFTLKRYAEVKEPRVLLEALNVCYADMWGHQHNDHPTGEELRSPRFLKYYAAEDILLLFDEKDCITGLCSVKSEARKTEDGYFADLLDAPGIVKAQRARGYQRPLMLAGIQHLRRQGRHPILLEFWGDDAQALEIYRSLGFVMSHHYLAYHREWQ